MLILMLLLSHCSCVPTLCDPIDGSPPGSPVPGILQARTLEWVATSFSNAWKWKVKVKSLSRVWLLATPWTVAYHAPPSMGFSRQEYWSGCHCLLQHNLYRLISHITVMIYLILWIELYLSFKLGSEINLALPTLTGVKKIIQLMSKHTDDKNRGLELRRDLEPSTDRH